MSKIIPLLLFAIIAIFLWRGLSIDPRTIPSVLIDKPAPSFQLPTLEASQQALSNDDLTGHLSIINVWATWCLSCKDEHAILMQMAQNPKLTVFGIAYKDKPELVTQWLNQYGNPYQKVGLDELGKISIDWGVYGTPETYVIDEQGMIRYKHIGALTPEIWQQIKQQFGLA